MARPRKTIPTLCKNAKGYLFSRSPDGAQVWFGHESKPESTKRYADWLNTIRHDQLVEDATKTPAKPQRATVNEVCLRFITEYCPRYRTGTADDRRSNRSTQWPAIAPGRRSRDPPVCALRPSVDERSGPPERTWDR
ncbi:hypothetical protein GC163_19770 [bacterium]|nr:hypothetical protein [bacterium]